MFSTIFGYINQCTSLNYSRIDDEHEKEFTFSTIKSENNTNCDSSPILVNTLPVVTMKEEIVDIVDINTDLIDFVIITGE